ncbi:hypothetical protein J4Q44_G00063780, partial [Coregonus suidteri]
MTVPLPEHSVAFYSPTPTPTSHHMQNNSDVKFTSSFSIESILKRDGPPRLCPRPAPLSVASSAQTDQLPLGAERGVGTKRRMSWDSPPVEMH